MNLCIGFSVPVAGSVSEVDADAGANAESMADATHAPIDRQARNKAPGFPKNLAAARSRGRPRRAVDPIANTAVVAIAARISHRR
jgi:hypothetical protein